QRGLLVVASEKGLDPQRRGLGPQRARGEASLVLAEEREGRPRVTVATQGREGAPEPRRLGVTVARERGCGQRGRRDARRRRRRLQGGDGLSRRWLSDGRV